MHTISFNFLITYKKRLPILSILGLPFIYLSCLPQLKVRIPSILHIQSHQFGDIVGTRTGSVLAFPSMTKIFFLLNLWNPTSKDDFPFLLQYHHISLGMCSIFIFVTCHYVAGKPWIFRYCRQLLFNAVDKLSRHIQCCGNTEDGLPPNSSSFFCCNHLLQHPSHVRLLTLNTFHWHEARVHGLLMMVPALVYAQPNIHLTSQSSPRPTSCPETG